MPRLITFFLVSMILCLASAAHSEKIEVTQANVPTEITFTAKKTYDDPFNKVEVNVVFAAPDGSSKKVPAFWDCGNVWKVRYASSAVGIHRWRSECNDVSDAGLHGISGELKVAPYHGDNPFYKHGPISVAPDHRHFQHADGTPFFWLGDTWWMGLCHRLHWPEEFQQLAADRKQKGFNVIQLVAGLYPDMFPFDPRGANEKGFPWETNYARLRPEYFDAADVRLRYLVEQGFTPCIVGAWGYFLPWMGVEKAKQHWRELIARYGAWPVVWCIAGEDNLPWYLAKNFPYDDREQVRGWTEVARYVRATDPFHRLVTIHPTGLGNLNARGAIGDAALLDFDMLQTPHGERDAVLPTINSAKHSYQLTPPMPMLSGEASYEMLMDKIPAQWSRAMFWLCLMNGAAGHTYGANGIWQCNRREKPHGPSPHHNGGNGYGTISWDDAMRLPGSQQVADGKKFLEKFPWQKCSPQPDSVAWDGAKKIPWKDWIWFPEGEPAKDAPIAARYFRWKVNLPNDGTKLKRATFHLGVDNHATMWVNGERVGEASGWQPPQQLDVSKWIKPRSVIAIRADNEPAPVKLNPAGLIAALEVEQANGATTFFFPNSDCRASSDANKDWQKLNFDDSNWPQAKVVAQYGDAPWGKFAEGSDSFSPFAIGIEDTLRIVYALEPRSLLVKNLRPNGKYLLSRFNPVSGKSGQASHVAANDRGQIRCAPEMEMSDWVVALQLQ